MPSPPETIHVLWITAGLGCDGDTVAITAATNPRLEDLVMGAIPRIPRVELHNPLLAYDVGDRFLEPFERAARGELGRFILVVEGSVPDETTKGEGYWAGFGTDPSTGQPILTCTWIDRLAPHAWAVVAAGTCATYGGIHAMAGNPTGCMGLPDYLGWDFRSRGDVPIVCVPGCPVQPDDFMDTLLYLLRQSVGRAPIIPLDDCLRPRWLFNQTVHEACDRGGYYEQADFGLDYGTPKCIVKLGCWGPVQRAEAGVDGRRGRLPERRRRLHRLHDAGVPRQVHALHGRAPRRQDVVLGRPDVRPGGACAAQLHHRLARAGAGVAQAEGSRMSAPSQLVEMSWDPITRVVGSLGLHTRIDLGNRRVAECHCTSSIFRGYSIFMQGKDPRDAHFITSRICGICGDNHATCALYAQNMAFGVKPPPLADWMINLAEAAEYMFDHNLFQENLVGVDFCERMVAETNPGVLERANATEAPHAATHGYRTIGDIMRALNPFSGDFYREALRTSRLAREMYCLIGGRHVHPSTLYPGGIGTTASVQLLTEYLSRLMQYVEFMKRVVPLHDDLFDFFYEALPGYEEVGRRRTMLGSWGSFQNPEACDYDYRTMPRWGREMYVTPGIVVDGEVVTTDLVEINLGIRVLLGSSYYDDREAADPLVTEDPLGNPVDRRHPWNQRTIPRPQKRDFAGRYTWVTSPRWRHPGSGELFALDSGGGPLARLWVTALAGHVDMGYVRATGRSIAITLPRSATLPEVALEWKIPAWSNTLERNRARTYFQAYAAAAALYFTERALDEVHAGRTRTSSPFAVPEDAIGCGFHEAVRGLLSHHVVLRDGKIANYHPFPPTTRCRTRRCSRRTVPATSRGSTSCARCGASIPACPAECTCISAGDERR